LILARSAAFPSRVWYSPVGDARNWRGENWFGVDKDAANWITAIFIYQDRFYVMTTDKTYQVSGGPWHPTEAPPWVTEVSGVPGTVSNRSVVVTDRGVFYLAEDGFRFFDGAQSVKISDKIKPTIDGYVAARLNDTAGVWVKDREEIWWAMTATGAAHNRLLVLNLKWMKWSIFVGMNCESIAAVEDANDLDQILFGTASTTDGHLYKAENGTNDNAAAISVLLQTGFVSPLTDLTDNCPTDLILWLKRAGDWSIITNYRLNFGTANAKDEGETDLVDTINVLSGSYPDNYFQDATDQRARVQLGADWNGHSISVRFSNARNVFRPHHP